MRPLQRSYRFIPTLLFMALIFWFSSMPAHEVARAAGPLYKHAPTIRLAKPVQIPWLKVGHFIGYAGLGASLLYAFGPGKWRPAISALAVTALYAVADEFHQTFTPGRSAGVNDVLIDMGAACIVILMFETISSINRDTGPKGTKQTEAKERS